MIKFVASHLSGNGGTETVLVQVLNHLSKKQNVELIVFGKPTNTYWLSTLNDKVNVKIINVKNKYSKLFNFVKEALMIRNKDTVISLSPAFIKLLSSVRKLKHSKYKIISWIHFSLDDQDLFNPQDLTYADYHLAISNKIKKQLIKLNVRENKIAVIFNPVKEQHAFNNYPHYNSNIAYVGRITFAGQKNLKELFTALKDTDNVHLYIVGSGDPSEVNMCKDYIRDNKFQDKVTWAGWQKDPWAYLRDKNIDGTILTSKFEGLPMVFLESIARGIPVISSKFDGYDDVVKNEINGLIYEPNNFKKLGDNLTKIKILTDKNKIQSSIQNYYSDNYFKVLDAILENF